MNSIFRKHIIVLIITFIIAITSLFGVAFLIYTMDSKITKVLETKEKLSSYQKNNKAYIDESNKMKGLEKRVLSLESNIINEQTIPTFLSSLEALAQRSGTEFEITSVQNPVFNETKKLLVDFSIRGNYNNVRSFLDEIQHQSYQIQISNLELSLENQPIINTPNINSAPGIKPPIPVVPKEKQWRVIGTIDVLSF